MAAGWELLPTTCPGDARTLAARATRDGYTDIIAAGGDGTLNEVVNGIGDVPGGFEKVTLGFLPLGTINVFARELGLPLKWQKAWQVASSGKTTNIDVGQAEFINFSGTSEKRFFVQLAGAGLDARAVELVSWKQKKMLGPIAYIISGFRALSERHETIEVQGTEREKGELVLFGNGRLYGGSFNFFPRASLQDGLCDVAVFPKVTTFQLIKAVIGMYTGSVYRMCEAQQQQAAKVQLSSDGHVPLQLDGDLVGQLPATITVLREVLRVRVP
ncbi:MAG: YegS/Rv2252/BmrU family lipid kinase [Verrucomicrobiales bacterium]|nr:YegS/Rv2252/BmrU family lipid kinase [Verrucomicrobiales bacterium]